VTVTVSIRPTSGIGATGALEAAATDGLAVRTGAAATFGSWGFAQAAPSAATIKKLIITLCRMLKSSGRH
jgi:hypothetical protein